MSKQKELERIIAKQLESRKEFFAKNLAASSQNEAVQISAECIDSANVPEGLEVRKFTIPDIHTLKQIAGKSDELFSMNFVSDDYDDSDEEVPQDLKSLKGCGDSNTKLICSLMRRYVYGDSRKVAAHERLLSRLYFPMELTYLGNANTDLVVEPGKICVIGSFGKTTVIEFGTITLGEGAKLVYHGIVDLSAKQLIQEGEADSAKEAGVFNIGSHGGAGGNGGDGGVGANGAPNMAGSNGGNGSAGTDGTDGGDSQEVYERIETITGKIIVGSIGGNGGDGGKGGNGGKGGDGGNGKAEKGNEDGGNGGNGGMGGNGGRGGNAGNGATVTILTNSGENVTTAGIAATAGKGGGAGLGGIAGKGGNGVGGKSGASGSPGTAGKAGDAGFAGKAGRIDILPYPSE